MPALGLRDAIIYCRFVQRYQNINGTQFTGYVYAFQGKKRSLSFCSTHQTRQYYTRVNHSTQFSSRELPIASGLQPVVEPPDILNCEHQKSQMSEHHCGRPQQRAEVQCNNSQPSALMKEVTQQQLVPTKIMSSFVLLICFFLRFLPTAISPAPPYQPIDQILICCGSESSSTDDNERNWDGDARSKYAPLNIATTSIASETTEQGPFVPNRAPYTTAPNPEPIPNSLPPGPDISSEKKRSKDMSHLQEVAKNRGCDGAVVDGGDSPMFPSYPILQQEEPTSTDNDELFSGSGEVEVKLKRANTSSASNDLSKSSSTSTDIGDRLKTGTIFSEINNSVGR
ncbi:unnamed protein product [Fraxinus pennsylvanica]|uniref:Uncharacterized protein n=1 Tax=Fraxinus pennsylvanica TaxID=56036 RepID=A0AAD1ZT75_9LAMI|nr:unnamed protein product [Fraxinus pennsylvanica]